MRRYLLVLDMDLLAQNEELDLEPINYLAARQEQERGEVVVLSVIANRQVKLSRWSSFWALLPPTPRLPRPSTPQRPNRATLLMPPPSTVRT